MKRIMIIPLDERPCNVNYVQLLAKDTPHQIIMPNKKVYGNKKKKANTIEIKKWIEENIDKVEYLILSIDMICYGGIVPSRLHYYEIEELLEVVKFIRKLKEINNNLKIYAFNLIMRNPTYSSSDEEPDYYEDYGKEIHLKGVYLHKEKLGIITKEEETKLAEIEHTLPDKYYIDYTDRRATNLELNKKIIDLLDEEVIDYLVIPQDDASQYGLTTMDQEAINSYLESKNITSKFLMYPEADAVVNALFARCINDRNEPLKFFVEYAVKEAAKMIPKFEDRPLEESINAQIKVTGSVITNIKEEADLILKVNAASVMSDMFGEKTEFEKEEYQKRDLVDFVKNTKKDLRNNKKVILADLAYSNGSEEQLIQLLRQQGLLFRLAGYAAWNTAGNTLGTCIAQGIVYHYNGETESHLNFLGLRYVEDYLYMSKVRKEVTNEILLELGFNYFNVGEVRGVVSNVVKVKLEQYIETHLSSGYSIKITDCFMPWKRMFEVGLSVEVNLVFSLQKHTAFKLKQFKEENNEVKLHQIVFLGDSITESFNLKKFFPNNTIYNRGISGDDTFGLLDRLKESIYDLHPSKVFILIGTNDLCNSDTPIEIANNINKVVMKIKEFDADIEIYIQSVYPICDTHDNIYIECRKNSDINRINELIQSINGITYIDTCKVLLDGDILDKRYTTDGLHLNDVGYQKVSVHLKKYL